MTSIDRLLTVYGESHRHPVNKLIHRFAVPIIAVDMVGLLSAWSSPAVALLALLAAVLYYARLCPRLAVGMAVFSTAAAWLLSVTQAHLGGYFQPLLLLVFVGAWAAQFVGHHLEGKRPSFLQDLQFLLIGPLWILADTYRRLGIGYGRRPG